MKKKYIIIICILIITGSAILYLSLYYKEYKIKLSPEIIYEIEVTIGYPYKKLLITDKNEIKEIVEKLEEIKYTKPHLCNKFGWNYMITIREDRGEYKKERRITISNDEITFNHIDYKMINSNFDSRFSELYR